MEVKNSIEIIQAGLLWANWTDEQKEAMLVALKSLKSMDYLSTLETKLEVLSKSPYTKILLFLEDRKYHYSIVDVLTEYQKKLNGYYVSHTMNDCINNLENEIKEIIAEEVTNKVNN